MEAASVVFPQWAILIDSMAQMKDTLVNMDAGNAKVALYSVTGQTACFKLAILTPSAASKPAVHSSEWHACIEFDSFQRALCERCIPFDSLRKSSSEITMHRVVHDLVSRYLTKTQQRIESLSEEFEDETLALASALLADEEATASRDFEKLAYVIPFLSGLSSSLLMVAACRRGRARESLELLRKNGWKPASAETAHAMKWMNDFGPAGSAIFQLQALRSELECSEFFERMGATPKFTN